MVVCQFYLRDQCKSGSNCHNEHPVPKPTGFGVPQTPQGLNTTTGLLTPESIQRDFGPLDKPLWPLSSCGTAKHTLLTGLDISPEELRTIAAEALWSNKGQEYIQFETTAIQNASNAYAKVMNDAKEASKAASQTDLFTPESIQRDFGPLDKPLWPLSSYGTARHEPTFLTGLDISPEELRARGAKGLRSEEDQEYIQFETTVIQNANNAYAKVMNDPKGAFEAAFQLSKGIQGVSNQSNTFGGGAGTISSAFGANSAFGQSAFGQNRPLGTANNSAFDQPAPSSSAFGSSAPAFGQGPAVFGASSTGSSNPFGFAPANSNPLNTPGSMSAFAPVRNPSGPSGSTSTFGQSGAPPNPFGQSNSSLPGGFGSMGLGLSVSSPPNPFEPKPTVSSFGAPANPFASDRFTIWTW